MNRRRIKEVLNKKFDEFTKSISNMDLRKRVQEDAIITGGSIASLLLNEPVNDYDIYFKTKKTALDAAKYYVEWFNEDNNTVHEVIDEGIDPEDEKIKDPDARIRIFIKSDGIAADNRVVEDTDDEEKIQVKEKKEIEKYSPIFLSSNAISLTGKIQLIIRFFGDAEEIHKNFDFVHCMNYWEPKGNKLELKPLALESLLIRELKYVGSLYPLCSVIRTRKFIKKGWHINAGQYLKMAYQISELDLNDIDTLEEQLIGVDAEYFRCLISALKEKIKKDPDFKVCASYLAAVVDRIFGE